MNESENAPRANWLLGLVGGVVGGAAGYGLFFPLYFKYGLYGIALPGAGIGLGATSFSVASPTPWAPSAASRRGGSGYSRRGRSRFPPT